MKKYTLMILAVLCVLSVFLFGCSTEQQNEIVPEIGGNVALQESTGATTPPESQGTTAPSEPQETITPSEPQGTTTPPETAPQVSTCSHSWQAATCTSPKNCTLCGATEGKAVGHKEVVDPAVHATFSVPGRTEGKHCSVCGKVTKAQTQIPALGSDMVVGTDYFDREGQTTYRYSYSFTLYENDRFNLTTLVVGSDESYQLYGEDGKLNFLDNGIYELVFENGKESMYGKFEGDQFQFCNKDGSKWEDKDQRPQGSTGTPITPRPGNSTYGYKDLANNTHGKSMQELYYRLYAACEAFMDNKQNVKATNGTYVIDKINLDYYVLTAQEAVAVWKVFYVENPRYYWLANTVELEGGVLYVAIDKAYASASDRSTYDAAIDNMANACAQKLSAGMSQLEKAMAIHDFILDRMNYAYKSDGKTPQDAIWAHNMIGCASKKSGVCEAYAKTYQYLCQLNGLECIVVTGYNGENHAWNMVKLNGSWYGVDCTFDETNTDAIAYNCFGMDADRMSNEYNPDKPTDSAINYLYKLPKLAEREIELVDLYKNGQKVGAYANIDAAFEAMTDASADYEIKLYLYDVEGVLLLASAPVEHQINATRTPKVKSITISGNSLDLKEGAYYSLTKMWINKDLTTNCDLTISNMNIYGKGSLNIKGNKLTFKGRANQLSIPVKGSMDASNPSEIVVEKQKERTEFWESVEVYNLRCRANDLSVYNVILRADSHFVNLYTDSINIYDNMDAGIRIDIDNLYPQGNSVGWMYDIRIQGAAVVNVNNIVAGERDYVSFEYQFSKNESVPKVTIKDTQCKLRLYLYGHTTTVSTDMDGNVVYTETTLMDYSTLNKPVMYLGGGNLFNDMEIYICNDEDFSTCFEPKTEQFKLNSKNQVIYKG